ncbi:hypothetical protein GIB67_013273 [Kingdonia uniflora]|uniref:Uncharacterized protein n=1 Tax=Kingdonia uniflora TaxID=39325 RepID=A0A7J7N611_9MAGN|nr:hypothetical protein GIB67_013273 [Kingdonia uniflora]
MVLEEGIAFEMRRLKLKYFCDQSLEMFIPAPIPATYQGLSEDEANEADEEFYCKSGPFHLYQLFGGGSFRGGVVVAEEGGRLAVKIAKVRERIFGAFGYDTELPVRECQLEGLDVRSKELEYARYFYVVERERHMRMFENLPVEIIVEMGSSSVNGVSTSGRTSESDSKVEVELLQFLGFPGQLISYPPSSDAFREFCKAKAAILGKWGNCVEYAGRQLRSCTVAAGEEYFYLLADLEYEKWDRGIDELISLEYFDRDVRSDLPKGFLCYLSQLEYGLSLPLTNLVKGIMNATGVCHVQLNGNKWEVITLCDYLIKKWEKEGKVRRITLEDVLQFYRVKNYKASGGSYLCASATWHRFFDLNLAGRTWNGNVIWVKGMKSQVERKESLLDEVAEEKAEPKFVLEGLGLSRKKKVDSKVEEGSKSSVDQVDDGC